MANAPVSNTTASITNTELLTADGSPQTVSKTVTFDNGASPPFAVAAGAAVVPNLDADKLDGEEGSAFHNATNLNAGTVPDARFPATLPAVSGANLTNLDASDLASGTIPLARNTLIVKPTVVELTDGATPAMDASLGSVFELTAAGNRTIAVPTNPTDGQKIVIRHKASGADRTLALNTGAGGFRFGTDITALSATTSAKWDYIGCIYNGDDSKWDVVAYSKGY